MDGKPTGTSGIADFRPRLVVIGAGSRGTHYARATAQLKTATIVAVAEPIRYKRDLFGRKFIWGEGGVDGEAGSGSGEPSEGQAFESCEDFVRYEKARRARAAAAAAAAAGTASEHAEHTEEVPPGYDGVFVCTLDDTHVGMIELLAPLGLHIMCEKPLATNLADCLRIYKAVRSTGAVFSIGHVLRYSPHNMLLRQLLLEDSVVGDIISLEHTEPVGYWHFSHSYVRGNWRKESTSAPSLLTKSCHDIDFILWMMCAGSSSIHSAAPKERPLHLPSTVSSSGSLSHFKRSRKPRAALDATNCLSCPIEGECMYSAKEIYVNKHLIGARNTGWPVKIVEPEIEEILTRDGLRAAEARLTTQLSQDYTTATPRAVVAERPWFGRCVYESDNDVCDDQVVTMTWDEEDDEEAEEVEEKEGDSEEPVTKAVTTAVAGPVATSATEQGKPKAKVSSGNDRRGTGIGRPAKLASFHMVAFSESVCQRRGRVYGTRGEVEYDSKTITVYDFGTDTAQQHFPMQMGGGHGGGDEGLTRQFIAAIQAVVAGGASIDEAQREYVGCTLEDAIRSHAMVFAAEEARRERKVVDWKSWWQRSVLDVLGAL